MLSGEQISKERQDHIGLPLLWVLNLSALEQMENEALVPGRPDIALEFIKLP